MTLCAANTVTTTLECWQVWQSGDGMGAANTRTHRSASTSRSGMLIQHLAALQQATVMTESPGRRQQHIVCGSSGLNVPQGDPGMP